MSGEAPVTGAAFSDAVPTLLECHLKHLREGSGLSLEVIRERKYKSVLTKRELAGLAFTPSQQNVPGLIIPLWGTDGSEAGYQLRPDSPRLNANGKPVKYELPAGSGIRLDCPPRCLKNLGNPKIPLWITEGSKKADALASHGVCAISVTGVWGFKGKNEFGATTFLSDWEYIALKDRLVYLAFDSDIVTKEPVRKALEHLGEHLRRKDASVRVVRLPQLEGQSKTGIDDFLLKHSLEEAEKLAGSFVIEEDIHDKERFVPGFVLRDGTVGELVVDGEDERSFIVAVNGTLIKTKRHETPRAIYLPADDPLVGEVVHFAERAIPYDSQRQLFSEVRIFVHRYLELPADFEEIASLYVLLTWVYEFAPSIPYLRVLGDWGSGKTRFLQVVGSVCFRPTFASGATTPSPIFRILEQFRGTLVLDEADFKDSSSWTEMVKLLNNGYRPGMPVLRADKENGKWFPRSYQVFGPKLIATRFPFQDEALESRCLTAEMMPLTRADIPRVLPPAFDKEIADLRAKLLTFRLGNLARLKEKTFGNELLEQGLQPRLQEILIPLKAMLNGDHAMVEAISSFVHRLQESLFLRRRESAPGRVLAALIELHEESKDLTSENVARKANEIDDEVEGLSAEKVGRLTKRLGFAKERVGKSRQRLIVWDENRISKLIASYGLQMALPLPPEKPSKPSLLSALASNRADSSKESFSNRPPYCPPVSEAGSRVAADRADGADSSLDKGKQGSLLPGTGMTVRQILDVWVEAGKPAIVLGPGENCFDLSVLLANKSLNERHGAAIKDWLNGRDKST